jgi:FKBP-type peptidyl-prolyl cis-trans isomerase
MRLFLISTAAVVGVFAFTSCGNKDAASITLSNDKDSLSYFLGMWMGSSFKEAQISPDSLNSDMVMSGLRHAMDSTANFSMEDAVGYIQKSMAKKKDAEDNKALEENKNFLAENGKKNGVQTTTSGLQYEVIASNGGASFNATDSLLMSFKLQTYENGQLKDAGSADSIMISQNRMFPGLMEGVGLMKIGDRYKFYIPSELGEDPEGQMFPKHTTVAYEVTIHGSKPAGASPKK